MEPSTVSSLSAPCQPTWGTTPTFSVHHLCVCVCVSGGDCGLVPSWKMPRCSSCLCPRREITAAVEVLCGGYTQEEKVHKNPDINLFNSLPLIFHYVPSVVEEALNVCHRYKQAPGELQTHTHTPSAAFYFSHTKFCLFFVCCCCCCHFLVPMLHIRTYCLYPRVCVCVRNMPVDHFLVSDILLWEVYAHSEHGHL